MNLAFKFFFFFFLTFPTLPMLDVFSHVAVAFESPCQRKEISAHLESVLTCLGGYVKYIRAGTVCVLILNRAVQDFRKKYAHVSQNFSLHMRNRMFSNCIEGSFVNVEENKVQLIAAHSDHPVASSSCTFISR